MDPLYYVPIFLLGVVITMLAFSYINRRETVALQILINESNSRLRELRKLKEIIFSEKPETHKQEALSFVLFIRSNEIKYGGWAYEDVWNDYQRHKLIDQQIISEGQQTDRVLIKSKKVK